LKETFYKIPWVEDVFIIKSAAGRERYGSYLLLSNIVLLNGVRVVVINPWNIKNQGHHTCRSKV